MTHSNTNKSLALYAFKMFLFLAPITLASLVFSEMAVANKDFAISISKIVLMANSGMLAFFIYHSICHKIKNR